MNKQTLIGNKKSIYLMLKILKFCTGSSAKSYQCKFAVDRVFRNKEPSSDKIGEAIREVINYPNIRGMFTSVHGDLAELGVTRIVIGDSGLHFEGSENTQQILRAMSMSLGQEDAEEDEEDKMLRKAMAMSLAQDEE